jgi:hypothetical protein
MEPDDGQLRPKHIAVRNNLMLRATVVSDGGFHYLPTIKMF